MPAVAPPARNPPGMTARRSTAGNDGDARVEMAI